MQFGDILCLKVTGELVFILDTFNGTSEVQVRRPTMGRDGIKHVVDRFYQTELETAEEHLRHEAKEMLLKGKIQQEIFKATEEPEVAEKVTDISVN